MAKCISLQKWVCVTFTLGSRKVTELNFIIPSDDSQRKQYEEWLQETQQLLQMQQKYLEEQIGAHRKSKKALSAKQRTAKKAGREFPEEDAEQLKHVTEQQSMVQKQLEQVMAGLHGRAGASEWAQGLISAGQTLAGLTDLGNDSQSCP